MSQLTHVHTFECIEQVVEDYTNANGGTAYLYYSCTVTGETHRYMGEFEIKD